MKSSEKYKDKYIQGVLKKKKNPRKQDIKEKNKKKTLECRVNIMNVVISPRRTTRTPLRIK